jgi:FkbM family methyltransferase
MPALSKMKNMTRRATSAFVEGCARLAEVHPFAWKVAWEAVHQLPFLLPHDKSYNAFRHFIAKRPNGLFLDVGANDGISILSFRKFDRNYRILALEPNPLLEPALKRIKSHDPHLEYKMVGAGAAPARLQFFVPVYRGILLHTFTSSAREQVEFSVARSFGKAVAAGIEIKQFECEVVRLDELSLNPTLIKIDAEGFDYDVLLGLIETIARSRPFVVTEIASDEYSKIKAFFDELDYDLLVYNIFDDHFDRDVSSYLSAVSAMSGHRNFFAVPQEMASGLPFGAASGRAMSVR